MFFYKVSMTHGYTQLCQGRGDPGFNISVCPSPQPSLTPVRVDSFFFFFLLFIYLAVPGLIRHTGSLAEAYELLVAACGI